MSKRYWGKVWCQTDFGDGWLCAKIRPKWWWWLVRVWALRRWVFMKGESNWIGVGAAWAITRIATGLPPCEIHRGPRPEGAKP